MFAAGWIVVKVLMPWATKVIQQKYMNVAQVALAVMMVAYLGTTFSQVYDKLPLYQARAAAWDARQQMILNAKAAGQLDITVPEFDSIYGITELGSSPDRWVNRCAALYYGVENITAEDGYMGFGAYSIAK
jgi:Family of unknown function (DUF6056)